MKPAAVLSLLVLFAAVLFALPSPPAVAGPQPIENMRAFVLIHGQTNDYRRTKGVPELRLGFDVSRVAQAYAEFLAANNATGHQADGRTPGQRLDAMGFRPGRPGVAADRTYCGWAENVYEFWMQPGVPTWHQAATNAVAWWKQSPGHEANLRHSGMTAVGVGAAAWNHGGRNYVKVVQLFIDDCVPYEPARRVKGLGKRKIQ